LWPALLLAASIAALGATRIRVDTSFKRQFPSNHPVRIADDILAKRSAARARSSFSWSPVTRMGSMTRQPSKRSNSYNVLSRATNSRKTLSIVDYVKEMHRALHGGIRRSPPSHHPTTSSVSTFFSTRCRADPKDLNSQIDPDHSAQQYACS